MSLPPAYESRAAQVRIVRGLVAAGCSEARAEWAARTALAEAPFQAPTGEGWSRACRRARVLAHNGRLERPDPDTGRLGFPSDGVGVAV